MTIGVINSCNHKIRGFQREYQKSSWTQQTCYVSPGILPNADCWNSPIARLRVMLQYPMRKQPYPEHPMTNRQKAAWNCNHGYRVRPFGLTKKVDILEKRALTEQHRTCHVPWNPWYRVIGHIRKRMDPWS